MINSEDDDGIAMKTHDPTWAIVLFVSTVLRDQLYDVGPPPCASGSE